jgi:hypothetical protein
MTITSAALTATALGILLSSCATESTPPPPTRAPISDRTGADGIAVHVGTVDPKLQEYLVRVGRKIKANLTYPCEPHATSRGCAYRNARLTLEFGILKNGAVQYVEVKQSAGPGLELYEQHAVEAIRRSSPFDAMSPDVTATLAPRSTGVPVRVNVNYVVPERSNFGQRPTLPGAP